MELQDRGGAVIVELGRVFHRVDLKVPLEVALGFPVERAGEGLRRGGLLLERGRTNLVGAVRRILDGERDKDALCASLDRDDWLIVATILRAIADPATLSDLAPPPAL